MDVNLNALLKMPPEMSKIKSDWTNLVDWPRLTDNFIMYQKKLVHFFNFKSVYLSEFEPRREIISEFFLSSSSSFP